MNVILHISVYSYNAALVACAMPGCNGNVALYIVNENASDTGPCGCNVTYNSTMQCNAM